MTKQEIKSAIKEFIDNLPDCEKVQVINTNDGACKTIGSDFILAALEEL